MTKRHETALHEAAHAVVSFGLGVDFMYIVLWDDENGEVVPECAKCPSCNYYYEKNDPASDEHSQRIQDQLRCEVAISVAGEIADAIAGHSVSDQELEGDRYRSRNTACFLHCWTSDSCPYDWTKPCERADSFLAAMKTAVEQVLKRPDVWAAVQQLTDLVEHAERGRTSWEDATKLISNLGVRYESIPVSTLPPSP